MREDRHMNDSHMKTDHTKTVPSARIALVLGSGGTAGGAFHAGVLKALHDVWGKIGRAHV